jgi:hypothetical protein
MTKLYSYHLVENSPWPLFGSMSCFVLTISGVLYMKGFKYGLILLYIALVLLILTFIFWFRDIIREATYQGHHTHKVRKGLQLGMILFIVSEICFFVAFFWAYFHSSLTPAVELGAIWPPKGIAILNPWNVPLLNTVLLLSSGVCQKWNNLFLIDPYPYFFSLSLLPFSSPRVLSTKRIGPHNFDILSILMGSLLGDGSMEKDGNGSRFCFYQEKSHGEYLLWLYKTLFELGYCNSTIPTISSRFKPNGDLCYIYRFRTYTYSSLNWIYDSFYVHNTSSRRKIIPSFIDEYLSPLALAVWIMDDGSKYKDKGIKFCTNSFTLQEVKFLANILNIKYSLITSIHKTGAINQYNIYVTKESTLQLAKIVKPYIHETMLYKIT